MGIKKHEMPDRWARVLARKRFVQNIGVMVTSGGFSVRVYKFVTPGCICDWIVVFKASRGTTDQSKYVHDDIATATQQAPIFLSR